MPSRFSMASGFSSLAMTGVSLLARRIRIFREQHVFGAAHEADGDDS